MVEEGTSTITAPLILIVEFLVALALAVGLLYKYGDIRRQNVFVTVSTLIVWFLSFVIIFLLPVDVSSVSVVQYSRLALLAGALPTLLWWFLAPLSDVLPAQDVPM